MRITSFEVVHCPAGSRQWSFLRLSTDTDVFGWSEYTDGMLSGHGLTSVIESLAARVIGMDPRNTRQLEFTLLSATREAAEGLNRRGAAAILNASLEARARAESTSVADVLGGRIHQAIPTYWSHCGLARIRMSEAGLAPPLATLADVVQLGAEVREGGFAALKTNLIVPGPDGMQLHLPAWGGGGSASMELDRATIGGVLEVIAAFREGAGPDVDIYLDVNFNVKGEAIRRLARTLSEAGVAWFEVDSHEFGELRAARGERGLRIASGEAISGLRGYRALFEAGAVDVPVIDIAWNGIPESVRIADLAESYDLNVAPHNYASHLLTHMNAQFAATVPNLCTLECDVEGVPWRGVLCTPPQLDQGELVISDALGWGCVVDEVALKSRATVWRTIV